MKRGFGGRQVLGYLVKYCPMLRMRSFGGPGGRAYPMPSQRVENLKITPQPKPELVNSFPESSRTSAQRDAWSPNHPVPFICDR